MSTNSGRTTEARLAKASIALENTVNTPEIQQEFTTLGYTPEKIAVGSGKLSKVRSLIAKQKKEYGDKYAATEAMQDARGIASKLYSRSLKIARIVLTDTAAQEALQLKGNRKESIPGWLQQATIFYTNLLNTPEYLEQMATAGATTESLTAEFEQVKAVESALQKQKKETGEAQAATVERDNAIDDLFDWMSDFYKFAHIALEDLPQWREKLGLLER